MLQAHRVTISPCTAATTTRSINHRRLPEYGRQGREYGRLVIWLIANSGQLLSLLLGKKRSTIMTMTSIENVACESCVSSLRYKREIGNFTIACKDCFESHYFPKLFSASIVLHRWCINVGYAPRSIILSDLSICESTILSVEWQRLRLLVPAVSVEERIERPLRWRLERLGLDR